jgi:hypothetical protein
LTNHPYLSPGDTIFPITPTGTMFISVSVAYLCSCPCSGSASPNVFDKSAICAGVR